MFSHRGTQQKGFTLIEIMIVLGIIAATLFLALPKLFHSNDSNLREVARNFSVLSKEVRNRARLTQSTMRIVMDMNPVNSKYWVEKSSGVKLIDPKLDSEEEQKKLAESKNKENAPPPDWTKDTVLIKTEKKIPSGLSFGSVETENMKAPQTEGMAYIYFFPEGLMQASAVQITDHKNITWTLLFNPLTGQVDIAEEAKSLKEVSR